MALVVGTNSYVTVAEADAYFLTRYNTDNWRDLENKDKEKLLITATEHVDRIHQWVGSAVSSSQSLAWPRTNATYYDKRLGLTVSLGDAEIPNRIKNAVYEQAMHLLNNPSILSQSNITFESISVGPISISDSNSKSKVSKYAVGIYNDTSDLSTSGGSHTWWRAW